MSAPPKSGILSNLPNPATRRANVDPVVVPPEAEQAFGLGPAAAAARAPEPSAAAPAREPERSKTFFLPIGVCERLEMQKLSERREMKHILRQALEEYFERNPLRAGIRDLFRE